MDTISSLKLADLKRELRARNLPITGTKQILVDRLLEAIAAEKPADDSNIDDLLDEDSMLGEEESDAGSDENVVADPDLTISSPTTTVAPVSLTSPSKTPVKRSAPSPVKSAQNGTSSSANRDDSPPSKKKIILNREPIPEEAPQILPPITAEAVAATKAISQDKRISTDSAGEKAVVKISEVTTAPATDKLKLRQEKFGAAASAPTTDVTGKLQKRAERFGVASAVSTGASKVALTPEDQAKIARRRERFGLTTDDKVDELKSRRAERFGIGKSTSETSVEIEDRKKQRAARFAAAL